MTIIISDEAVNIALNTWLGGVPAWRNNATERLRTEMRAALTAAAPHLASVRVNVDEIVQPLEDIHAPGGLCRWTDVATAIGEVRRALSALEPSAARELALEEAAQVADARKSLCTELQARNACAEIASSIRALQSNAADARPLALEEGFRKGLEAACDVIDAHNEYDRRMCCDGRECGCYGATVHQSMQHYIRALSSPDHADAGKVDGDGWRPIESAPTNRAIQIFIPNADYYGNDGVYAGILVDLGTGQRWATFGWAVARDLPPHMHPSHWRPLPSAPSEGAE